MEDEKKSGQIKEVALEVPIKGFKVPAIPDHLISNRSEAIGFSISEFSDSDLEIIGNAWTANLIEAARQKRKLGEKVV